MVRVQGLLLNIEICQNIAIKSQKNRRKITIVHTVVDKINIMFSGSRIDFQIRKLIYLYFKKIARNDKNWL